MTADRIKEIQNETAVPDSVSVCQALMKVWNECEQERMYSEEDMRKAYSIGWITRERFDDQIPDIIYPQGLDYEEKQEYAFNLWFEQFKKK